MDAPPPARASLDRALVATPPLTQPAYLVRRDRLRRAQRRRRVATAAGLALVAAAGAGLWLPTRHEVVGGVEVGGVEVGGLSRAEARARIAAELSARLRRPVTVEAGTARRVVIPAQMGVRLDVPRTVAAAYDRGRIRGRLLPFLYHASVDPVLRTPRSLRLPPALLRVAHPPVDARPVVRSDGTIRVVPGREGIDFAPAATYAAIADAAIHGRARVRIEPQRMQPAVTTSMAESTAADARRLLAAPIALHFRGRALGTLTPRELAPLLTVRRTATGFAPGLDAARLPAVIGRDVRPVSRPARNAGWITDGETARVRPGRPGRGLDATRTAASIVAAGLGDLRRARVYLTASAPALTTAKAKALGVRKRVVSATTDMGTSSPNRIHNVHLMADLLDGHVVRPGETFSFNATVGERTAERGFREGQEILNGMLVPSIGGGVCQVASTLFDAALDGGYAIRERRNHSLFISHYGAGKDATVSWGGPDFKFTNDSPYGLLIRMTYTDQTLTTNFYSTDRPIEVETTVSEPTNFTPPRVRYVLDPAFEGARTARQTVGSRGFDVTMHRVVRLDDKVLHDDRFLSRYVPDDIFVHVGPDYRPPGGARVESQPRTTS